MSNVLARKRGISEMEFYGTAENLRNELSSLLFRDKAVPKKYRANVTYPALASVNKMMTLMHKANRIFPYTPEQVDLAMSLNVTLPMPDDPREYLKRRGA